METVCLSKKTIMELGAVIPGYPVGLGIGLVPDGKKSMVLEMAKERNVALEPAGCGYDFNNHGVLYRFFADAQTGEFQRENVQCRREALAEYLEIDDDAIAETTTDTLFRNTLDHSEYMVLTDEEATIEAKKEISESLWAFNTQFIIDETGITPKAIAGLKEMQEHCCENCSELIRAIIDATCGFEKFAEDAIAIDGRGHFINRYDGKENEQKGFYIYQM